MCRELILGAEKNDRVIPDADDLLRQYRQDTGCDYLDYQPITPHDRVVPEDLAVTLLLNSQIGWRAFYSLMEHGSAIDLTQLPNRPLEETTPQEREQAAALIGEMAQLSGFATSVATKVLHKKRPDLIPILDNQAIFGAYMNPNWPERSASTYSIKDTGLICEALNWIAYDLNRPENGPVWDKLRIIEPTRSTIELFDSVWWMYFRQIEPVIRPQNRSKARN